MKKIINIKLISILFFITFLLIGLFIYQDFGISLDEKHHRENAFFWYTYSKDLLNEIYFSIINPSKYILSGEYINIVETSKYNEMGGSASFVGSPLSVFCEFLIEYFNVKTTRNIFHFRHLFNFLIFFIGVLFFYFLIFERYKSYLYSLIGVLFFCFTPRFFAESFYNQKDIFFLSLTIINIYFGLKYLQKPNFKISILFSLTSALAFNTRIMALIPIFLILFIFLLKFLRSDYFYKNNRNYLFYYLISLPFFIIMFWPYLWTSPISNFIFIFKELLSESYLLWNFYIGEYVLSTRIPWHYHIVWIGATSPIVVLIFFILGIFFMLKRLFHRFNKIDNNLNDLWRGDKEMFDFYFLTLVFSSIIIFIIKTIGYSGWRHLYFIYPSIIMISINGFYRLKFSIKSKIFINIIYFLIFSNLIYLLFWNFKFHPHQYVYFNPIYKSNFNEKFDMDYWGLSNNTAINYIIQNNNNYPIKIATKSFAALHKNLLLLSDNDKKKVDLVTPNEADFVITNYSKRVDNEFIIDESKYKKYYEILVDNISINTVYKKINNF